MQERIRAKVEIVKELAKAMLYLFLTIGGFLTVYYYGFVARVLPSGEIPGLLAVLVVVGVLGTFGVFSMVMVFSAPGWVYRQLCLKWAESMPRSTRAILACVFILPAMIGALLSQVRTLLPVLPLTTLLPGCILPPLYLLALRGLNRRFSEPKQDTDETSRAFRSAMWGSGLAGLIFGFLMLPFLIVTVVGVVSNYLSDQFYLLLCLASALLALTNGAIATMDTSDVEQAFQKYGLGRGFGAAILIGAVASVGIVGTLHLSRQAGSLPRFPFSRLKIGAFDAMAKADSVSASLLLKKGFVPIEEGGTIFCLDIASNLGHDLYVRQTPRGSSVCRKHMKDTAKEARGEAERSHGNRQRMWNIDSSSILKFGSDQVVIIEILE